MAKETMKNWYTAMLITVTALLLAILSLFLPEGFPLSQLLPEVFLLVIVILLVLLLTVEILTELVVRVFKLDRLSSAFLSSVCVFFTLFLLIPIFTIVLSAFFVDGQLSFEYFVSVFKNPLYFDLEIRSFLFLAGFCLTIFFASRIARIIKEKGMGINNFFHPAFYIILGMGFVLLFSLELETLPECIIGIVLGLTFVSVGVIVKKVSNIDFDDYFLSEGIKPQILSLIVLPVLAFILWIIFSIISQYTGFYDVFDHSFITHFSVSLAIVIGIIFSFFHARQSSRSFLMPFLWMASTCLLVTAPFLIDNINKIVNGWEANFYSKIPDIQYGYVIVIGGLNASILVNSLFVSIATTLLSAVIGVFFAFIIARYEFRGKSFARILLLIPLVVPPFVGAIGIKRMLAHPQGYSFFNRLFYDFIPFLEYPIILRGLTAVILVQSVHFYTLVYLNSLSAFQNIDPTLEEQAENFGARGGRIFRSITFPLALPGIAAGSILTFILSVEDLGTPLIFSGDSEIENLLTTRVFRMWMDSIGNLQPDGLALAVILFVIAMIGFTIIRRYVGVKEYAMVSKGATFQSRTRRISTRSTIAIWFSIIVLMSFALLPHVGTFLLAVSDNFTWTPTNPLHLFPIVLSYKLLSPDIGDLIRVVNIPVFWISAWVAIYLIYRFLKNRVSFPDVEKNPTRFYGLFGLVTLAPVSSIIVFPGNMINTGIGTVVTDIIGFIGKFTGIEALEYIGFVGGFSDVIQRTVVYALIAVILIIIFGIAAAYVLARKQFPGKYWFDTMVTSPIAIPGIIVGFGLFSFYTPLLVSIFGPSVQANLIFPGFYMVNILLVASFTVRRFPFTVRAAYAGLQQTHVTFEEASKNLGASNIRTITRITIPLIAISVIAGAMMSFVYSLGEVSTSLILLANESQATIPWMINEKNRDPLPVAGVLGMNQAAALGMLLVILQVIIISIANSILKRRGSALTGL